MTVLSLLLWDEAELCGDLLGHLSCLVPRLACEDFCLLCHRRHMEPLPFPLRVHVYAYVKELMSAVWQVCILHSLKHE